MKEKERENWRELVNYDVKCVLEPEKRVKRKKKGGKEGEWSTFEKRKVEMKVEWERH